MQLHAEEAVSAHMANLQEEFSINQRIIKRSFCQHFLCRNPKILNQAMKSSNRCYEIMDKSEEEIIKSFSEKQNDCLSWKGEKDTIMTPLDSLGITSTFTIRIDGNGTTNR
jgi:penicillin-binding protein 1A